MPSKTLTIWIAVFPALVVPFLFSLFYFVILDGSSGAQVVYTAAKVFTLAWPIFATIFILGKQTLPFILHPRLNGFIVGLAWGAIISVILLILLITPLGIVVYESVPQIKAKVVDLGVVNFYWEFAILISLVHSLIEEYYWRWFVFGALRIVLPIEWQAHLISAFGFTLHHIVVTTQYFPLGYGIIFGSFVGIGGFIWSKLYVRYNNLFVPWISHIVVDLVIFGVGFYLI